MVRDTLRNPATADRSALASASDVLDAVKTGEDPHLVALARSVGFVATDVAVFDYPTTSRGSAWHSKRSMWIVGSLRANRRSSPGGVVVSGWVQRPSMTR